MHRLLRSPQPYIAFLALLLFIWACVSEWEDPASAVNGQEMGGSPALLDTSNYMGSESCAPCHKNIYKQWQKSGKGRDLRAPGNGLPRFNQAPITDPNSSYQYRLIDQSGSPHVEECIIEQGDTLHKRSEPIDLLMGSGNQTVTPLRQINGYLYELPITYYSAHKKWALSPGYAEKTNYRFDRPIGTECLHCHSTRFSYFPHSFNRYRKIEPTGIGCEKCHGPGQAHVRLMESERQEPASELGLIDLSGLTPQRQLDVCMQCHLEGITLPKTPGGLSDFVPGQDLSDYVAIFHPKGEADIGFASHGERLQLSACFRAGETSMTCGTCHDPHKGSPKREDQKRKTYNAACQSCHGKSHSTCSRSTHRDSSVYCASCHMPAKGTRDIPHVFAHDHWIQVPGDAVPAAPTEIAEDFISFQKIEDPKVARLYLSYFESFDQKKRYLNKVRNHLAQLDTLQKMRYYYLSGRSAPSYILKQKPENHQEPQSLFYLAELRKRYGYASTEVYARLLKEAPHHLNYRWYAAGAYAAEKKWEAALALYQETIRLDSTHQPTYRSMAQLEWVRGRKAKARDHLRRALELNPEDSVARQLGQWWNQRE